CSNCSELLMVPSWVRLSSMTAEPKPPSCRMRGTQAFHRHLAQLGALNFRAVGALRHREFMEEPHARRHLEAGHESARPGDDLRLAGCEARGGDHEGSATHLAVELDSDHLGVGHGRNAFQRVLDLDWAHQETAEPDRVAAPGLEHEAAVLAQAADVPAAEEAVGPHRRGGRLGIVAIAGEKARRPDLDLAAAAGLDELAGVDVADADLGTRARNRQPARLDPLIERKRKRL